MTKIDFKLDWEYGVSIKQIREDLDKIEELGANCVEIESYSGYEGCHGVNITPVNDVDYD